MIDPQRVAAILGHELYEWQLAVIERINEAPPDVPWSMMVSLPRMHGRNDFLFALDECAR